MGIDNKYLNEHRLKTAHDFERSGFNLHAMQIYYSIIFDEPEFAEANFSLAELLEKQGNITAAKKVLTDFITENPTDNFLKLHLAQFLLRNSMWDEVINVIQSVDINEEPIAALFLGYSSFMMRDYEQAEINFKHFIRKGKKTELLHEAYIYLAKTEIELGKFKASLEYAKKAEVVYSNFWELNLIYAVIYYNMNMFTHAVSFINKTVKLNPDEPDVCKWGGKIFLKAGEYLKAEEYFLKYISMVEFPASEIYSELGDTLLNSDKTNEAIQYYELALKVDPMNKFAANGMNKATLILESDSNEA